MRAVEKPVTMPAASPIAQSAHTAAARQPQSTSPPDQRLCPLAGAAHSGRAYVLALAKYARSREGRLVDPVPEATQMRCGRLAAALCSRVALLRIVGAGSCFYHALAAEVRRHLREGVKVKDDGTVQLFFTCISSDTKQDAYWVHTHWRQVLRRLQVELGFRATSMHVRGLSQSYQSASGLNHQAQSLLWPVHWRPELMLVIDL